MFTGLIEETGVVKNIRPSGDGMVLEVGASLVLGGLAAGDSISINGACQTVTAFGRDSFSVFVSRVTLDVTTLGGFRSGRKVNLERAMTPMSRFGGHIVQGHVDGRGTVRGVKKDSRGLEIEIEAVSGLMKYIVPKGSVAVDGISLTVVSVTDRGFLLYVIPETAERTDISGLSVGDEVNIETDILAKYVERMLARQDGRQDDERLFRSLAEGGFI